MDGEQLPQLSSLLMSLINDATQEALEMLTRQSNMVPFVLLHTHEGRTLRRFNAERNADAIQQAKNALQQETDDTIAYVLVYDALITYDGQDVDALILEAGERPNNEGIRFAQRYAHPSVDDDNRIPAYAKGHIAYLGKTASYFTLL
jgi:hypothetical protein